MFVDIGVWR